MGLRLRGFFLQNLRLFPNYYKVAVGSGTIMFAKNHINEHCIKIKLQHYDRTEPNHAYMSIWLVA